ncbi:kinase-like domain-containing protein [Dichotomocladium elegans]|nr:kinase-like domain-containing protein [Dichotomocladium elegans]
MILHPLTQPPSYSSSHHCIHRTGSDTPASITTNTDMSSVTDNTNDPAASLPDDECDQAPRQHQPSPSPMDMLDIPHDQCQQQQPSRNYRAHSATAIPKELESMAVRGHPEELMELQRHRHHDENAGANQPWWQYYYDLHHYHPPAGRKPTVFGPYLLLKTLGEGEFGKVKFAVHIKTGQEVAIKLIKKDNLDSSTSMSKVEREISVLRRVRHPYIVKLYDVIETERYIGIILECASGGELFEYILAHRYLKEKDASRIFAQLISGVNYLHQKNIVHRDLKLENLLLGNDRCVVITDFGFANQFSSSKDDLMSTSCGSPCYAAPELVISEGLYVGSAADIWSCGVILYAMLCGYLPFDDDPANPDGDNINLLYKYILNTELAFPDILSNEARDLLQKMLVPDPTKRCTIQTIMEHPWLNEHRALFEKSIAELEKDAMDASTLPLSLDEEERDQVSNMSKKDNDISHAAQTAEHHRLSSPSSTSSRQKLKTADEPPKEPAAAEDNPDVGTRNVMSFDLPSSSRRSSDYRLSQQTPMPRPSRTTSKSVHQRGTEMIKNFLSKTSNAANNRKASRPVCTSPEPRNGTPQPGQSILHAKFLSSVQRQQPDPTPPVALSDPPRSTMSTPHIPETRRPHYRLSHSPAPNPRPTRTSVQLSPATPTPHPPSRSATTRRKALSLLVAPVVDPDTGKKTMAFSQRNNNRVSRPPRAIPRTVKEEGPMPSVSEQILVSSTDQHRKSAGNKLMNWLKKKPTNTRDPWRAPSGLGTFPNSSDTHFNDARLRTYHGAVDQNALTSRHPVEVLTEARHTLASIGIEVKEDGEYKLKCIRRRKGGMTPSITNKKRHSISNGAPRLRMLLRRSAENSSGTPPLEEPSTVIFGDPVVDPGEEVRFSIEICKIKNLPGLYILDIRRMRGNVWSYKFLYHAVLGSLDLGGKGGYMAVDGRRTGAAKTTPTTTTTAIPVTAMHGPSEAQAMHHRASVASSSNNSSSVMEDSGSTTTREEKIIYA